MKKKLVVLSGAGISAESGIRTFRDSDGLWNEYRIEDVATPEGFERDPELVLNFYNNMRKEHLLHQPNYGHVGLVELEKDFDVHVVTQNIDDLHERAGSKNIIHLHGELMKVRSVNNPTLVTMLDDDHCEIHLGDTASDGAQLRPDIVWFGEAVPNMEKAMKVAAESDIFLIVGTSLNVYPAASLVQYTPAETPVYVIDPKPVSVPNGWNFTQIQKGASEGMKDFIKLMHEKYGL